MKRYRIEFDICSPTTVVHIVTPDHMDDEQARRLFLHSLLLEQNIDESELNDAGIYLDDGYISDNDVDVLQFEQVGTITEEKGDPC